MKTQPLLLILVALIALVAVVVGGAIALKMTDTPLALVTGLATVIGGAVVAGIGRSQVFSKATVEEVLAGALQKPAVPSEDATAMAKKIVSNAKDGAP